MFLLAENAGLGMLFTHSRRELPQCFLLVVVEVPRDGNIHRDKLVTSSAAAQIGDSLAAQAEHGPRLGSFRNGQLDFPIQGWVCGKPILNFKFMASLILLLLCCAQLLSHVQLFVTP